METRSPASLKMFRLARHIIAVGFLLNALFCLVCRFVLDLDYPFNTFLFRPVDRFQDFYSVMRSTEGLNPYLVRDVIDVPGHGGIEVSNYFPFTHIVFYPFTRMPAEIALVFFLGLSALLYTLMLNHFMRAIGVVSKQEKFWSWAVFLPMNYAVLFTFDRGNIELWVFGLVVIAIYLYERCREYHYATLIGMAASFKLIPFIFLFPAITERRWKAVFTAALVFVGLSFFAFLFFDGTIGSNLESLKIAFFAFGDFLLVGGNGVTHSINVFSAVQAVVIYWNWEIPPPEVLKPWLHYYNFVSLIFLGLILLWSWIKPLARWRRWAIICCLVQALPFPSYDYRLLYTLISLGLVMLNAAVIRRAPTYVWLLCLTAVPKMIPWIGDVRISVLLNPLLILATLSLLIFEGPDRVS